MPKKQVVSKAKAVASEVIRKDDLQTLNGLALGLFSGKGKYVEVLYSLLTVAPSTIVAHARHLEIQQEDAGGGRSGPLLKTLRANLRYLAKAHDLKAIPTIKAVSKDGPLELTEAKGRTGKAPKAGGKCGEDVGDITLGDVLASVARLAKGLSDDAKADFIAKLTETVDEA